MSVLEAALRHAARGRARVPVQRQEPYVEHGLHDATTDQETIERWWRRWPAANVAIRTGSVSGLLVVDADDLDSLASSSANTASCRARRRSCTPRGGQHYWFRHPGGEIPSSAGKLAPGVDVRGEGGYVIAPPSARATWWTRRRRSRTRPAWLLERLQSGHRNGAAPKVGEVIPEGERNDELASIAGTMRRRGLGEAEIEAALQVANRERCQPPLDEQEVERHRGVGGALRAGRARTAATAGARHARANMDPLATAELLDELKAFITRFVVLPSPAAGDLLALWVLHTHAFDAAWATPYLRIISAAPDSGKTLLMEVLAAICRRGWHAVNPSVAVLYRKVDRDKPTLLLDEMDNYPLDDRRDALSVLNAGYKRGATVDRCNENGDLESFDASARRRTRGSTSARWSPRCCRGRSRSGWRSKPPREQVEMWIAPLVEPQATALRERCEAWAEQHVEALTDAPARSARAVQPRRRGVVGAAGDRRAWPAATGRRARRRPPGSSPPAATTPTTARPSAAAARHPRRVRRQDRRSSPRTCSPSSTSSTRAPGARGARARASTPAGWRGCFARSRSSRGRYEAGEDGRRATTSTSSRTPSPATSQKRHKRHKRHNPHQHGDCDVPDVPDVPDFQGGGSMSGEVAHLEPWLDKKALAAHLGCCERWIEYRAREGMPRWKIAGRVKFRASEVEAWLIENGHMERVDSGSGYA